MLSITDAVENQALDAAHKVDLARHHPWRFLISGMLAGMWVGAGVYVMFSTAGSFFMQGSAATRLVSGAVFAIALTFVVFAGGQLATSAMMALPMGAMRRVISWWQATWTLGAILVGNLLGSLALAWVLKMAGIFTHADTQGMLDGALTLKMSFTPTEMFFRAVMCNILVCGAIWAASRVKSEAAKAIIIFWGVFGFIASMFEHVVANMTVFGLGLVGASTVTVTWSAFGTMLLWVGLGNLVGGLVVLGVAYTVVGGPYGRWSDAPAVALTQTTADAPLASPTESPDGLVEPSAYASTESIAAKP